MILFVGIVLAVAAAFYLSRLIMQDAGYVLVSYGGSAFELSFWKALIFLAIVFLLLYFTFRLLRTFFSKNNGVWRWNKRRQRKTSQQNLSKGLQHFFEGDWQKASKSLVSSAKKSYVPDLHYLVAARACQQSGDLEGVEQLLLQADASGGEGKLAIELCKAQLLIDKQSYKTAAQELEVLMKKHPKHAEIKRLLLDAYLAQEDWASLSNALPQLKKQKDISDAELSFYQERIASDKISKASEEGVQSLMAAWKQLNKASKSNMILKKEYIAKLLKLSALDEAEQEVRSTLKSTWDAELIEQYGLINGSNPAPQLKQVEQWLKNEQEDSALFLAAGRIAVKNELWGKAKTYFEKSASLFPNADVYAELGKLCLQLEEKDQSLEYFKKSVGISV